MASNSDESAQEKWMSEDLRRLRIHLARASGGTIRRIATTSGRKMKDVDLQNMLHQCKWKEHGHRLQRPLIQSFIPPHPGHTVCVDLFYVSFPMEISKAFVLLACALTRFVVVEMVPNVQPTTILNVVANRWISYFGRIARLLLDRGPGLVGSEWALFAENWSGILIYPPVGASHSNGIAERQISIIKDGFAKVGNGSARGE